jgi:hypothetical protein
LKENPMFKITNAQLWVRTRRRRWRSTEKVGMEIAADVTPPSWGLPLAGGLTPAQPEVSIVPRRSPVR